MMINGTGAQLWPLTTGNNDRPDLSQGGQVNFFFNSVPDRCPSGPLAYYLPMVLLTITGLLTQPASTGAAVYWDKLLKALLTSVQLQNAWHGTVISANHVTGANLPLVEYISNGYRFGARRRPPIPATAGAYSFRYTVALTPSVSRLGRLMSSTAQLAALFSQAQLQLRIAPSSVITGLSPGATLTDLHARASAVLVPRNELVLGTPVETIMHQVVAGSSSNQIQINGFGTETMLTGVQNKGGVVYLGELTTYLGGVFDSEDVEFFNFPWRGQGPVYDIDGYTAMSQLGNLPNDRPQVLPSVISGGDAEFTDYPYGMNTNDEFVAGDTSPKTFANLMAWNLGVQGGNELDLTDIQTADGNQSYFMTVNGGFSQGAHLVVGMYAKAWQENMAKDWLKQVTKNGNNSLAAYVLGSGYTGAKFEQRAPRTKHIVSNDQMAYLPWQMYMEDTARK